MNIIQKLFAFCRRNKQTDAEAFIEKLIALQGNNWNMSDEEYASAFIKLIRSYLTRLSEEEMSKIIFDYMDTCMKDVHLETVYPDIMNDVIKDICQKTSCVTCAKAYIEYIKEAAPCKK